VTASPLGPEFCDPFYVSRESLIDLARKIELDVHTQQGWGFPPVMFAVELRGRDGYTANFVARCVAGFAPGGGSERDPVTAVMSMAELVAHYVEGRVRQPTPVVPYAPYAWVVALEYRATRLVVLSTAHGETIAVSRQRASDEVGATTPPKPMVVALQALVQVAVPKQGLN